MKTKYRIVGDTYSGYECQKKPWWCPFFYQMGYTNTHTNLDEAKKYIEHMTTVHATFTAD